MSRRNGNDNGALPPCEPCRRANLRCDQSTPVCRRCVRHGKSDVCVYNLEARPRSFYSEPESQIPASPTQEGTPVAAAAAAAAAVRKNSLVSSPALNNRGSTISLATGGLDSSNLKSYDIQTCARILRKLVDNLGLYEAVVEDFLDRSSEGCILGRALVRLMFAVLKQTTQSLAGDDSFIIWAQRLVEVMRRPVAQGVPSTTTTTPEMYVRQLVGRWEGIGFLFALAGQAAIRHRDWKSVSQMSKDKSDQKAVAASALTASDSCLRFCTVDSDSLGWLLYQHIQLLTLVYGERHAEPWRKLAQLATVLFTLDNQNTSLPFFLVELRKSLLAGSYILDKRLASATRRPPQISSRYYNMQLPLDLPDEELMTVSAGEQLDADGWNSERITHGAQWLRTSLLIGSIREQILDLSLNRHVDDIADSAGEIASYSHQTWDQLPAFLRWQPGSLQRELIPLYLEFLCNEFMLYRVVVRRTHAGHADLITVAHKILSTVLDLIGMEIASGQGTDNLASASSFGIPAAGALAIELLCQTSGASTTSVTTVRRAEIIQKLSVFASYLQYVARPHEAQHEACQRAKHLLGRVLDKALSGSLSGQLDRDVIGVDWLDGEEVQLEGRDLVQWLNED
ncbi:hypothetical protein ASPZODRAFT_95167 [Penicilliopsis zonata CBS 506.65]|uniref:Zn(2)-C6 fungal-type domain-containing protein n=1 Tax=Penicilliopsis zonata CBS 506.65 TaxID=1073090 RepID=A0A1L9SLU8_9EURO|nr:hypothetical protein ASPZODRAFT_95167 [Penicilliopsis zonata CBS 506.65]OJJ48024.1 hypothetical protein ASPZODRAFT_95167 [Penicilliopsis zonata CBS 506.65]